MPTLSHSQLRKLGSDVFTATGATPAESRVVADALVDANLAGHDSHGVIRIPEYVTWIEQKLVTLGASMKVLFETEAYALIDGDWGFGQVIGRQAMELAIGKARTTGAATVAGRNCCHLGRIGDYPRMAADQAMAAVMFINTHGGGKLVAPYGGIERRLSANPISVAVPRANGEHIVVDISTCAIAEGKLRNMLNGGKPAPPDSIIDAQGNPTTSPADFYGPPQGALLPFGGHKGYALGLITDILAGAISGGGCSNPDVTRVGNTFLVTVIDIDRVRGMGEFAAEVENLVSYIKSSRRVPGVEEILIPGEPELREQARREREGIKLDDRTWGQIAATVQRYNVPLPV
jgi:uncharacterized oxidoreductase